MVETPRAEPTPYEMAKTLWLMAVPENTALYAAAIALAAASFTLVILRELVT